MKILVSNDDGVNADGIYSLVESLQPIADLTVVAPDRDRSGASNSLSLNRPLRIKYLANGFISVEGTPTDSVHLAMTGLLKKKPDLVVTGINNGGNLGDDVLYSGTVAAAMQGRFLGSPSIAFSLLNKGSIMHWETAQYVAIKLVKQLQAEPLPETTLLNVNIPNITLKELEGFEVTRLGTRHCAEPMLESKDPRGNTIYWVGLAGAEQDAGPGTDFHAIANNRVSITPVKIDLTHHEALGKMNTWLGGFTLR